MSAVLFISAFGFLGVAFCVLSLIRIECVYRARTAFLDNDSLYRSGAYNRLPTYSDMVHSPRYWHLWTKKQWIEVAT